jgi:hypothetical protein
MVVPSRPRPSPYRSIAALLGLLFLLPSASSTSNGDAPEEAWTRIMPQGIVPQGRYVHSAAYDPVRRRMIVFGGDGPRNDTWSLSLTGTPVWTNLSPTHRPSFRRGSAMIYDPVGDRIVLFGGEDGTSYNDVWMLSLDSPSDWTQLFPVGAPPPGRMLTAHAYDPVRDRWIIIGGHDPSALRGDVWALQFSPLSWVQIGPSGTPPAPRWGGIGCYDAVDDRVIIAFGSLSPSYDVTREVWSLSLAGTTSWTQLTPAGATLPVPRMIAAGAYDAGRRRLLIHAGWSGTANLADLWELSLEGGGTWTQHFPPGIFPDALRAHTGVFVSARMPLVIFGGRGGAPEIDMFDTWAFGLPPAGPPVITGFMPSGGLVGAEVKVDGYDFDAATAVSFNGVAAPILTNSGMQIRTAVPSGATSGPIVLTTPLGTATSPSDFFVGQVPAVLSATPDSGKAGAVIMLGGRHFDSATRVSFGGSSSASFFVVSDDSILATVDTLARSGPITITTLAGTGSSAFDFRFIPRNPRPRLVTVRDVPGDQGGKLVLAWEASEFDREDYRGITSYRVWRRSYVRATASGAAGLETERTRADDEAFAAGPAAGPLSNAEFWESLAEIPAAWLEGYAYTAQSLQDSTAAGHAYSAFFVQALTGDRAVFYNSNVDSAYSVDNLSPPQPLPFTAVYSAASVALHWSKSRASDFGEFRLYRGTRLDFTPGPGTLVIATRDTGYVDLPPSTGNAHYKLVAVDVHGNPSRFSAISPEIPVAALVSLVSFEAGTDHILLTWYTGAEPGLRATVHRRTAVQDWSPVGEVTADGSGFLEYIDREVVAGARYGYRLGITSEGAEELAGEIWVRAADPNITLEGMRPNPGSSRLLTVWFALPSGAPARIELLDLAGRRVVEREVGSLGPGRHSVNLASGSSLAPGIYHLRLTQGQSRQTTRVAVID